MGLNIISEDGAFFEFVDRESKILLYGMTNDALAYAKYLVAEGYQVCAFVDKDKEKENSLSLPVILPEEIGELPEKQILLMAKTEKVCEEMVSKLEVLNISGNVYMWNSFCIDTRKYIDGKRGVSVVQYARSVPWLYYDIYGTKTSSEYCLSVYCPNQNVKIQNDTYCRPIESHAEYWNFDTQGRRRTIGQPLNAKKTLHFFGDSRILGIGVEDGETIPSCLQAKINEEGLSVRVENYSLSDTTIDNLFKWMQDSELQKGDIVCFSCDMLKICVRDRYLLEGIDEEYYYVYWLKKIITYCEDRDIKFYYFLTGGIEACRFNNLTLAEKTALALIKVNGSNGYRIQRNHDLLLANVVFSGGEALDLRKTIKDIHEKITCFVDAGHYSPSANKILGDKIFQHVFASDRQKVQLDKMEKLNRHLFNTRLERVFRFIWTDEWRQYVKELQSKKVKAFRCGAIVMNANPFTKGHRYLIEYAAKKVDHLYVFVLEEDCSFFCFHDRIRLVKEGTKDLQNVTVFRGGEFIISKKTFPEYFEKQDSVANSSKDIEIFARLIAPILDIKYRFVGKEPYSVVTNGYNEQMRALFPKFGISFVEVERTDVDGEIISATKVRKACETKDIKTLKAMLPRTTFEFVKDKFLLGEEQ